MLSAQKHTPPYLFFLQFFRLGCEIIGEEKGGNSDQICIRKIKDKYDIISSHWNTYNSNKLDYGS